MIFDPRFPNNDFSYDIKKHLSYIARSLAIPYSALVKDMSKFDIQMDETLVCVRCASTCVIMYKNVRLSEDGPNGPLVNLGECNSCGYSWVEIPKQEAGDG